MELEGESGARTPEGAILLVASDMECARNVERRQVLRTRCGTTDSVKCLVILGRVLKILTLEKRA